MCSHNKMSQFKFESDHDQNLSLQHIEFVTGVLKKRGYTDGTVTVETVGNADDNFVANVKRIIVKKDGNTFSIIAKLAPQNDNLRANMSAELLFHNEHVVYTKILPTFTALEKEAGIPEEERFVYAKCYGSFMDAPNEIILLEDLKAYDLKILDKQKSLTDEEVRVVLKTFAKLHALSYALRYKDFEKFTYLCGELKNYWLKTDGRTDMEIYLKNLQSELDELVDSKYKEKLEGVMINMIDLGVQNFKYDSATKFSVIQQGDSWTNNIMFGFEGGKAVKCCVIDYQHANQNNPVADLQYMIFNCTDYNTRSTNYNDWINFYYKELGLCLENFGLMVDSVYPRDQLNADLKRQSKVAFALSVMLARIIMKETHENAKMKEAMNNGPGIEVLLEMTKLTLMEDSSVIRFKARIEGLIKSFVELGYL